jgi:hypothetical protein
METLVDLSDSTRSIKVLRKDLMTAIASCYSGPWSKSHAVTFKCAKGELVIKGPTSLTRITGTGGSDWTAHFKTRFGKFANSVPADAEVDIDFDGKKIDVGGYRIKAQVSTPRKPGDAIIDRQALAMAALEPFGVTRMQLALLCATEDSTHFTPQDQATIDRIAQAWSYLAPYGVTPEALRQLVSENLREALNRPNASAVQREGTN